MSSNNTGIGPECRRSNDIKWTEGFLYVVTTHILIITSFQRYTMMQGQWVKSTQENFWRGEEETHTHRGECAKRERRLSAQSSKVCSFFFSSWSRNELVELFLHSQVWAELCDCRAIGSVEASRLPALPWNTSCKTFYHGCIRWSFNLQPCLKSRLQFSRKKILSLHWRLSDINQSVNQSSNQSIFGGPEWSASRDFLLWSGT